MSRPCSASRTHLGGVSVLFAVWFGPRGFASIVLGLIVVAEAPVLAGRDEFELVVASTMLLSVLLHGVTAALLSAVYARWVEGMAADAQEKQAVVETSTRMGPMIKTPEEVGGRRLDVHMEADWP